MSEYLAGSKHILEPQSISVTLFMLKKIQDFNGWNRSLDASSTAKVIKTFVVRLLAITLHALCTYR